MTTRQLCPMLPLCPQIMLDVQRRVYVARGYHLNEFQDIHEP